MKKHYYTIITGNAFSSSGHAELPESLDDALAIALDANSYDEKDHRFDITHYETFALVEVRGRLRDGGSGVQTKTTTDIGRSGVRAAIDSLLAKFEKVQKVSVKILTREVDLNP